MSREQKAKAVRDSILKIVKKESSLNANEIRVVLALERIVSRLSIEAKLDKHLVYKGGFVLLKTLGSNRFTRDLDALGLDIEKSQIEKLVPQALALDLDDGFWFGDMRVESLDEQGEYGTLVDRSSANSRGKDVYDMGILFEQCDSKKLIAAIQETFKQRSTAIPKSFVEFAKEIDTGVLSSSWGSVKFTNDDRSFVEAWSLLARHLAKIDGLLN